MIRKTMRTLVPKSLIGWHLDIWEWHYSHVHFVTVSTLFSTMNTRDGTALFLVQLTVSY